MQRRLSTLALLSLLGASLAASGCENLPEMAQPAFKTTTFHAADGLEERRPAEIAVKPIHNQSLQTDVPLAEIREAVVEGLVDRLYSPLALDFVDGHWSSASFGGAAPPDALLVMVITHWDPNSLGSRGILRAGAELRLFEGGSESGPQLWGVTVQREIDVVQGQEPENGLVRDRMPEAIDAFVREVLGLLPERDPLNR